MSPLADPFWPLTFTQNASWERETVNAAAGAAAGRAEPGRQWEGNPTLPQRWAAAGCLIGRGKRLLKQKAGLGPSPAPPFPGARAGGGARPGRGAVQAFPPSQPCRPPVPAWKVLGKDERGAGFLEQDGHVSG